MRKGMPHVCDPGTEGTAQQPHPPKEQCTGQMECGVSCVFCLACLGDRNTQGEAVHLSGLYTSPHHKFIPGAILLLLKPNTISEYSFHLETKQSVC